MKLSYVVAASASQFAGGYIVLAVVAAILFIIIISNIKIVPQARACVIERLGRYHTDRKSVV